MRRTFGILDLGHKTSTSELSQNLIHASTSKSADLSSEGCRDDFVVFRAHFDLPAGSDELWMHSTTRDRSSSQQ